MRFRAEFPIGLLALLLLLGCSGEREPANPIEQREQSTETSSSPELEPRAPNIVLILLDTLRADHLAAYGYDARVAPFLASLAERSVVFQRAYSTSSWTAPSAASLFTGLYPTRHGLTRGFVAQKRMVEALAEGDAPRMNLRSLPEEVSTLPTMMKQLGYSTFGLAANINIAPELGFARGFDRFSNERDRSAEELALELRKWRAEIEASERSFLYLHFNDVHKPYNKRDPWYEEKRDEVEDAIAAYDSELHFVDRVLGSLYKDFHWDQNTIVWIISDHGEEFMDHGEMGHGFSLFEELMRVVGIVHAPGIEPGSIDLNVSLVDVLPTLLDWLDAKSFDARDGRSLLPLLEREDAGEIEREFEGRIVFGHRKQRSEDLEKWAAVYGSWKLIHDAASDEWMLFDLAGDPDERVNQYEEQPELVGVLRPALDRFKAQTPLDAGSVGVPLDNATLEHLRSLGYIGAGEEDH